MPRPQLVKRTLARTLDRARERVSTSDALELSSTEPVIDLDAHERWVPDLTENFDEKLSAFMDFDDQSSARSWLLDG